MTSASGKYVAGKLYPCNVYILAFAVHSQYCWVVVFRTETVRCRCDLQLNADVTLGVLFVSAFTRGRNHSLVPSLPVAKFSHEARIWKFIKELTLVSYRSILLDESPCACADQSQPGAWVGGSGRASYGAGKSFYIKSRHVRRTLEKRYSL